jgi:hypothetical protein
MHSLRSVAAAVSSVLLFSACQSSSNLVQPLMEIATPKAGAALMYLFRPAIDRVARSDQPTLLIDGQSVAELGHATYTMVSLGPGQHRLKLVPGSGESASWNTEVAFDVRAGETHFVAVWNQNQPGSDTVVPIPVRGSLIFIPIGGHVRGAQNVRFELVERDIASAALAGLRFVSPQVEVLTGSRGVQ